MKIQSSIIFCFFLITVFGCQDETKNTSQKDAGRDIGALHISKAHPNPGERLKIQYKPDSASVDSTFSGYYYTLNYQKISAHDLKMTDSSGIWQTQVSVPDSATAIAFNFKTNDEFDTNENRGFVQPLYTEKGKVIAGAKASKAAFHQKVDRFSKTEVESDSIAKWFRSDMEKNPEIRRKFNTAYARFLLRQNKEKAKKYIKKQTKAYAKDEKLSLEDYNTLIFFNSRLKNKKRVDSLQKVTAEKYPKSRAAQRAFAAKFEQAETFEKKKQIFKAYEDSIGKDSRFKDKMLYTLAQTALKNADKKAFKNYLSQFSPSSRYSYRFNNKAYNLAEKGKNLEIAAIYAKKALDITDPENYSRKKSVLTKKQVQEQMGYSHRSFQDTYAFVLFKQNKIKKAVKLQKQALGKGKDPEVNERYIQYLIADRQFEKAEQKSKDFIAEAHSTDKLKGYYKTAYVKNKGSEKGYSDNLAKLEKTGRKKAMKKLKAEMLSKEIPDLKMTDMNGKVVNLASLKEKTIILDFWATWCGPCKSSFPGMKNAVDFYKDDKDVKFYFVNTFQNEKKDARHTKVTNFIEKNNYPFDVVYDQRKDRDWVSASAFGIDGIPTKIIIGPDGKWRFTKVGFSGSNTKLLKEVKMMVKLIQSES
jgi:thiol-disulfide isomerase/thioredoxin